MTPEQKVAMLKEAGVWDVIGFPTCIDKLFDLVAAHEREACAKVCDEMANRYKTGTDMSHELLQIGFLAAEYGAYSIRKRGEK